MLENNIHQILQGWRCGVKSSTSLATVEKGFSILPLWETSVPILSRSRHKGWGKQAPIPILITTSEMEDGNEWVPSCVKFAMFFIRSLRDCNTLSFCLSKDVATALKSIKDLSTTLPAAENAAVFVPS